MKTYKKLLMTALAACLSMSLYAQIEEFKFSDHIMGFSEVEKEWRDQNFFTITSSEKPDIKECFLSFALAYPNDLTGRMVACMMGYDMPGFVADYVLDMDRGYIAGQMLTELDGSVQMCLWRTADGGTMVAVALQGDEYKGDWNTGFPDNEEDERTVNVNDLMFFKINKGEAIWRPITPKTMCGEEINFPDYRIQLPRKGQHIRLIHKTDHAKDYQLQWDGNRFSLAKG